MEDAMQTKEPSKFVEGYRWVRDIGAPRFLTVLLAQRAPWLLRAVGYHLCR
jgi:hypothetical protein